MDAFEILMGLLLGGTLGMIGQGIRVVAGLKKMLDAGTMDEFKPSVLIVSLLIGFIAGALAYVGVDRIGPVEFDRVLMLAILAAGYAGTDFIEAFMKRQK